MKTLLLALVMLVTGQAHAFLSLKVEKVRTEIRCVSAEDANVMYSRVVRDTESGGSFVDMLDYRFWPQYISEDKRLSITKAGSSDIVAQYDLGPSASSNVIFSLVMNDGDQYHCSVTMIKYDDRAPISLPF